jgi:hypothetical protein
LFPHGLFILDLQVFRKFVQIQGGKKNWPQAYSPYSEDQNFFPTKKLGKLIKTWTSSYTVSKQYLKRKISLNRFGCFGGGRERVTIVYEEIVNGELLQLQIKLENTEPGHWELFVPTESEWRLNVPERAMHRRDEISERIRPFFNNRDIHFSDDIKQDKNA